MTIKSPAIPGIQRFSTIVLPTDYSKGAEQALSRVLCLPLQRRAVVHIIHVMSDKHVDTAQRKAKAAAETAMKNVVAKVKSQVKDRNLQISIKGHVLVGRAFEEIIRHSRVLGAELIVLGRHGRRPVRDMFIGSTAERVIKYGDLPVLVVNSSAKEHYTRPMAAVDFGETLRSTLETLLRVVEPSVTEIGLVHAYHVPFEGLGSPAYVFDTETVSRKQVREHAEKIAKEALKALPAWGIQWQTILLYGDARNKILAEAELSRVDLIALSTHARTGLSHVLIGSVAAWIVNYAKCDVLVTRPIRFTFQTLNY